jgi:hypothetical protein
MKTIYLKSTTKSALIADIASIIEGYSGETEFGNGTVFGHWIGTITNSVGYHANLLVPDDFNESIFETLVIPPPNNPVHQFA